MAGMLRIELQQSSDSRQRHERNFSNFTKYFTIIILDTGQLHRTLVREVLRGQVVNLNLCYLC